jgi:hypothetical protein
MATAPFLLVYHYKTDVETRRVFVGKGSFVHELLKFNLRPLAKIAKLQYTHTTGRLSDGFVFQTSPSRESIPHVILSTWQIGKGT